MDWTDDAVLREALVESRRALVPLPDTRVIDRPGWFQLVTPSLKNGGMNEVGSAILSDAEADTVIDRTLAEYRALGIRFRWEVDPESRPLDLAARLERRGLTRTTSRVMWRLTAREAVNSVEEISPATADLFTDVLARGWSMDPKALDPLHRNMLASGRHRLFLGRADGVPAGAAGMALLPNSVYLIGGVVLPEFRSRGVYRALVAARLNEAARLGLTLATTSALSTTSAPILERLGFRTAGSLAIFQGP